MLERSSTRAFMVIISTHLFQSISAFGLRALLVLYFVQVLNWQDAHAYTVFAAYISLMCIGPVIGGYLTDHYLGHKRSILFGSVLVTLGHLCMTFAAETKLFIGLSCIVLGSGLMLTPLCSLIGLLYQHQPEYHERAYNWLYLSVNLGGAIAGIGVGTFAQRFGWHAGFGIAAIGMVIALFLILLGWRHIENAVPKQDITVSNSPITTPQLALLSALIILGLSLFFDHFDPIWLVGAVAIACLGILTKIALGASGQSRRNIVTLSSLFAITLCYFILYEQSGTSIMLFTERVVNHNLFGYHVPTPVLTSLNPLYIILLVPFMHRFWQRLSTRGLHLGLINKAALGIILSSSAFLLLAQIGQHFAHPSLFWLAGTILILTLAELLICPTALTAISKLAPKEHTNTLMGVYFLTGAIASYLSSKLAKLTSIDQSVAMDQISQHYTQVFHLVGVDGLILGISILLFATLISRRLRVAQSIENT